MVAFSQTELDRTRSLWSLDPGRAFTNHGSYGAVPSPVAAKVEELTRRIERNPNAFFAIDRHRLLDEARAAVAGFLRAHVDGLAFVPNVTTAGSLIAAALRLAPGDELVVTSHGYGAITAALRRYAADAGARVRTAELSLNPGTDEIGAALAGQLSDRTRLVLLDHITSPTARLFDVAALARPLAERGIPVAVDGAHATGILDLDLGALSDAGVTMWFGNLHKWVCAPPGAAVLYAAPEARSWLRPLVVSWAEDDGYPHSVVMQGTTNVTSFLSAPSAIEFHQSFGYDRVRSHGAALALEGARLVAGALGVEVVAPSPGSAAPAVGGSGAGDAAVEVGSGGEREEAWAGMPMVLVPYAFDGERLEVARQIRAAYPVELALTEYEGPSGDSPPAGSGRGGAPDGVRQTFVRVSAHLYNAPEDYRILADALVAWRDRS